MRTNTLLIALLLLVWLLGGAWWLGTNYAAGNFDCFGMGGNNKTSAVTETTPVAPKPKPKPAPAPEVSKAAFTVQDGTSFKAQAVDGLIFDVSGQEASVPNSTIGTFQKLNQYLAANPDKQLVVQGRFSSSETNNTKFLSLGMARASDIKDTLVALGAKASQIELSDRRIPNLEIVNKRVLNGIRFSFAKKAVASSENDIAALRKRIEANPAILYFVTGGTNVDVSPKANQNIQSIKTYLNSVPTAKINVAGHTDNVGKRSSNINLSKRRAEQVKQYLVRRGFNANQLIASGKGPDQPAATNDTPAGREKNRRVEIGL